MEIINPNKQRLPTFSIQAYLLFLVLTTACSLLPGHVFAVHSSPADTITFTKRSGAEVYFVSGESVKCITHNSPRQLYKGEITFIGDDFIRIDSTDVTFDNIFSLEVGPSKGDDILTALLIVTPVLIMIGGLAQFASGLGDGSNSGSQFTEVMAWSFLGTLFLKLTRSITKKKVKNIQKRYRISSR